MDGGGQRTTTYAHAEKKDAQRYNKNVCNEMIGGFIMCGNEWESFLYCRKLCVHEHVYMCNAVMCDAYGLVICGREERTGDKLTFTNNCGFSYYREKTCRRQ